MVKLMKKAVRDLFLACDIMVKLMKKADLGANARYFATPTTTI